MLKSCEVSLLKNVSMRSTFLILKSENRLKELIHYKQIYLLFLNEGNDLGFTSVTSY